MMDILQYELARHGQWSADLQKKTKSFENMKASKTAGDIEKEKVRVKKYGGGVGTSKKKEYWIRKEEMAKRKEICREKVKSNSARINAHTMSRALCRSP